MAAAAAWRDLAGDISAAAGENGAGWRSHQPVSSSDGMALGSVAAASRGMVNNMGGRLVWRKLGGTAALLNSMAFLLVTAPVGVGDVV